jgi:hypothetical protein
MSASCRESYDNAWHEQAERDRDWTISEWAHECVDEDEFVALQEREMLKEILAECRQTKEQGRL